MNVHYPVHWHHAHVNVRVREDEHLDLQQTLHYGGGEARSYGQG